MLCPVTKGEGKTQLMMYCSVGEKKEFWTLLEREGGGGKGGKEKKKNATWDSSFLGIFGRLTDDFSSGARR